MHRTARTCSSSVDAERLAVQEINELLAQNGYSGQEIRRLQVRPENASQRIVDDLERNRQKLKTILKIPFVSEQFTNNIRRLLSRAGLDVRLVNRRHHEAPSSFQICARQGQEGSIWCCAVWRERNVLYKIICERCLRRRKWRYITFIGKTERPLYKRVTRNMFVVREFAKSHTLGGTSFAVPFRWRDESDEDNKTVMDQEKQEKIIGASSGSQERSSYENESWELTPEETTEMEEEVDQILRNGNDCPGTLLSSLDQSFEPIDFARYKEICAKEKEEFMPEMLRLLGVVLFEDILKDELLLDED
ncbi:hypothetical protein ACOME3_006584 [Neoechinorhynchus agilis]